MVTKTLHKPMHSTSGPELCHCLAARRSARFMTRLYDQHLAPSGLSISQFSILAMVETHPEISVAKLSELMVMERTTLMRALQPMRATGLLLCERSGTRFALQLTTAGRSKLLEAGSCWTAAQKDFEHTVGKEKAKSLRQNLLDVVFSE